MNKLVFLEPNRLDSEPFTTSKVVAEVTGVGHKKIKLAISKQKEALETFGKVVSYGTTLDSGQTEISYRLNEQQATLLITFLKNTPAVIAFKVELVRQFYAMRDELNHRNLYRSEGKPIHRDMTDAIQQLAEGNRWAYKQYTDLAYIMAVGSTAAQIRKQRGADKKSVAVDYMTADEIQAVNETKYRIVVLLEAGLNYQQIKAALVRKKLLQAV